MSLFLNNIRNINWNDTMQIEMHDVNYAFDMLINTVNGLLDVYTCHIQKNDQENRRTKSNPWISNGILISINKRDLLYKRYIKETAPVTKALLHEKFKLYRNKITSLFTEYIKVSFVINISEITSIILARSGKASSQIYPLNI